MKWAVIVVVVVVVAAAIGVGVLVSEGTLHQKGSSGSTPTYPVTFTEKALPAGTEWWVNQTGGGTWSSVGTTLSWQEPDGTYDFSVATADKEYSAAGGSYTVAGSAAAESVEFRLVEYSVTFTETGLQAGTEWFVNITGGGSFSSSASANTFSEPNGTYDYNVSAVGPMLVNSSDAFVVHGQSVDVTVRVPDVIEFTLPTASVPSRNVFYEVMLIQILSGHGLTTGMFDLALKTSTGEVTGTIGTGPASCGWTAGGTSFGNCLAPANGTWYSFLFWEGNGSVAGVYSSTGWSTTFPVTLTEELVVVSTTSLVGTSDTVSAVATGSTPVEGSSPGF